MFKRNQIQKNLLIAGVTLASFAALAQQSETTTATVEVRNAFVLTETAALSFGAITASQVSSAQSIILNPDGTAGTSTGNLRALEAGTPASYTISGAAPFTALNAQLGALTTTLSNPIAPNANPDFTVSAFTMSDGTNTVNLTSGALATADRFDTDFNGDLVLTMGATLTLPAFTSGGVDTLLVDGNYEGTYTLTVQY